MFDNKNINQSPGDCRQNEVAIDLTDLARKLSKKEKNHIVCLLENDPLDDSYKKCLIVYLAIAITMLLWPFDFFFWAPNNNAAWVQTSNGIEFLKEGKLISDVPAKPLYDQMQSGSGFSLEVWAAPITTDQSGPARIISYSIDTADRNFTLAQSQKNLVMRLRTTKTDKNGIYPHMVADDVFTTTKHQHITVTYDFSDNPMQSVYVNGQLRTEKTIPGGNFSNWDPSHYLVLGNEVTGERPWAGRLFYVSMYNRALDPHEILHNYMAGDPLKPGYQKGADLVSSGLVARYFFDEHTGTTIKDSSGNVQPLNLYLTKKLYPLNKPFLGFSFSEFAKLSHTCLNILIFIPFSFLLSGIIKKKHRSLVNTFFIVVIAGALFTLSIETIQYFMVSRMSSIIDVMNNILGTIAGVVLFRSWKKLLKSQSRQLQESSPFLSSIV